MHLALWRWAAIIRIVRRGARGPGMSQRAVGRPWMRWTVTRLFVLQAAISVGRKSGCEGKPDLPARVAQPSQLFQKRLESRIVAERVEVGVVLQPLAVTEAVLNRFLEAGDRLIGLRQLSVRARHVVQHPPIVPVDGAGSFGPFQASVSVVELACLYPPQVY